MFLLLLLCITANSTPIKSKSLEPSKSSIVRNKLITLIDNANIHQAYLKQTNGKENAKDEVKKLSLIDLEPHKNVDNNKDIKLAFNKEAKDLLNTLINALHTVNENLSAQNKKTNTKTKQIYVVKVNEDTRYARHKRDTDAEDAKVMNTSIAPEIAKPVEEDKPTTEAKTVLNETSTNVNKTVVKPEEKAADCNQTLNNRRSFNTDADTEVSKAVKARLLSYINEYFNDITTKTNSLRDIKNTFAANDEYSIGYIVANIDTLGINLHNLRVDIELNHQGWSEKQILDMFDKIKMSHSVVSSLLGALKTIMDKPPVKDGKRSQYLQLV